MCGPVDGDEQALVRDLFLLTLKPLMYIANVLERRLRPTTNTWTKCASALQIEGATWSPVCAAIEDENCRSSTMPTSDAFLEDMGLDEPGLNRVIRARLPAARPADLFHRGRQGSARAWQVKIGATAPQAAGVIHTDFERGFIRAETIALRRLHQVQGRGRRDATRVACAWKARNTSSRKATYCTSASTSEAFSLAELTSDPCSAASAAW